MRKRIKSVGHALSGYKWAFKYDTNFRLEVSFGAIIFLVFGYALWPLKESEILFLSLAWILILVTELINTAFERAFEKLHPERDALIGISKDIAAAAVLSAAFFALIVMVVILANHV
jgi:diacylglycerol kinase